MSTIIPYSDYDQNLFEYDRELPDPDPPRIQYKGSEKLFEVLYEVKGYGGFILEGSPQVGGGIWIIWSDDYPPEDYWFTYHPDYEPDIEDCVEDSSWEDWATDLWKNQKDEVGAGLKDFEEGKKILIKIDPELRDYLVDEIDDALAFKYEVHQGDRRFLPASLYKLSQEKQKILKRTLFFLENYEF